MIVGWKLWYADGSAVSSSTTNWRGAPRDFVQVLMLYEDKRDGMGRPTRIVISGRDWYYHVDNTTVFEGIDDVQVDGWLATMVQSYPLTRIIAKKGSWVDYDTYLAILAKAMESYSY